MLRVLLLISDGTIPVTQQQVFSGYTTPEQMNNDIEMCKKALKLSPEQQATTASAPPREDIAYHKQEIDRHLEAIKNLKDIPTENI